MDPLAEDFYSYSPCNYVGNNPIRRIDPDGNDWRDIVKGAVNAIVDNNTGGAINRRNTTAYSSGSDYNLGQNIGDAISLIASGFETLSGGFEAAGGAVVSVGSGGTLAVVGVPVSAAGVAQVAHGTLTMSKAVDNLTNQKGRVPNPNGAKGKADHQEKVKELAEKARAENPGKEVVQEKKIRTEGSNRRPDVQVVDPKTGKTTKVYEAERRPNSQRNVKREEEYKRLDIPNETHKVGN